MYHSFIYIFHYTHTMSMKKSFRYLIALVTLVVSSFSAQAQYEKGDFLINPGISLLGYGYGYGYYGGYTGFPALSVSVEYNVTDNIAVGGYGGFSTRNYKGVGRWTNLGIGARGVFHATEVLNDALSTSMDSEKWDIYGGLSLGYRSVSWSYDNGYTDPYNYGSGLDYGLFLGTRYMFNPNLGVYGELGRGAFGAITLGVTFKL